jgi:NADH dehydrogenase FAD-containing subunit
MTSNGKPRVVVLGGGFAGLESAFLLRSKLGDRAESTRRGQEEDPCSR